MHFEINWTETPVLEKFYSEVFGWHIQSLPKFQLGTERDIGGGIGGSQDGQPHVTLYAKVDEFQTYLDRAETLGGGTATPPTEAPGITFAQLRDPSGARVWSVEAEREAAVRSSPSSSRRRI